jgi:hypothetical protein
MNQNPNRDRGRVSGRWCLSLAVALIASSASSAGAQSVLFTEIYNSGVLNLGPDQTLQLTIVNNNNVSDPALPNLPASEEVCTVYAEFLDGNGNVLQKQQQTLPPGQNFSFSVNGPQTVQARVDITPGTSSGFASGIADQCVVSTEILNGSSSDAALFPPLFQSLALPPPSQCVLHQGLQDHLFDRQKAGRLL